MRGRSAVNRMYTPINAATAVAGWNVAPSPRTGHESEKETQGFLCQLGTLLRCPCSLHPATAKSSSDCCNSDCGNRIAYFVLFYTHTTTAARGTGTGKPLQQEWNAGAYGLRLGQPPLLRLEHFVCLRESLVRN